MPISTAQVDIGRPERYIKQLVSHLGRKATTELRGDGRGTSALTRGEGGLVPAADQREMTARAADPAALTRAQDVATRPLLRFATRPELAVDWSAPTAGDARPIVAPIAEDYLLTHCT